MRFAELSVGELFVHVDDADFKARLFKKLSNELENNVFRTNGKTYSFEPAEEIFLFKLK